MPANLSVQLDLPTLDALDAIHEKYGLPKSVIVARLLKGWLEGRPPELPKISPADLRKTLTPRVRRRGLGD